MAILKGSSADPILLIAPYRDNCPVSEDDPPRLGNAAFLLELGRVLSTHPMRYSIWLIFVPEKTDSGDGRSRADSADPTPWPELTRVVSRFQQSGVLKRVRVAVFFEGMGVPDSVALRDSHSHPIYREVFWESARDLELTDVFPPDAVFASSESGHHALIQEGLRRTVLVSATPASGISEPPAAGDARARAEALQSVGDVSLEAILRIQTRLERIDGLSGPPE
ncbi:MAG: hypothetical protein VX252_02225 [Myxococcota bacterium]|nr:hypothetical protein [Myxococcota bacterium]